MESDSMFLILMVVCLVLTAFFSAAGAAFSSFNRMRMKNLAEGGDKRAGRVLALADNSDSLASTLLITDAVLTLLFACLGTLLVGHMFEDDHIVIAIATLIGAALLILAGKAAPRAFAKELPEKTALATSFALRILVTLCTPLAFLFRRFKQLLASAISGGSDAAVTDEELLSMLEEAEHEGGIGEQEGTLIRSAIEFMDLEAQDISTPRVDIVAVSTDATEEEIAKLYLKSGFSRLPVYEEEIDHIVGTINLKDFYNFIYEKDASLETIIRTPFFITPTMKVGDLLKTFQSKNTHMAIILDEFGGTDGIITMEDIIEELVGEIWDEHDKVVEEIVPVGTQEYNVLGSANAEKFFEMIDTLYTCDSTTISGYICTVLECIPKEGDSFVKDGLCITVLKMDGQRIEQVRIKKIADADGPVGINDAETTAGTMKSAGTA